MAARSLVTNRTLVPQRSSGIQRYLYSVAINGVLNNNLNFGHSVNYVSNAAGAISFWWNQTTDASGYVFCLDEDDNNFIEVFFENGKLGLVVENNGVQQLLFEEFLGNNIGAKNQYAGNHHYQITWDSTSFQVFVDGIITPILNIAGNFVLHFTDPTLIFAGSIVFPLSSSGNGSVTQVSLFTTKLTGADENAYYYSGTVPISRFQFWDFSAGSGDVIHTSGAGGHDGILTGATWTTVSLSIPRTSIQLAAPAIGLAQVLNYANTLGYFPSQTFTVVDYSVLAGNPATAQQIVTDTAGMVGGTFAIPMAGISLVDGIDYTVTTPNNPTNQHLTAQSLADALNAQAGMTVATVVGGTINYSVSGDNSGLAITFDKTGLTPANTTFSGGIAAQAITINSQQFSFDDVYAYQPFTSNATAAAAWAAFVNANSIYFTGIAVGTTVTVSDVIRGTNHNGYTFTKTPSDSVALTLGGSTMAGGSGNDPLSVGSAALILPDSMDTVIPWTSNITAAASIAAYYAANTVYTLTYAVGDTVYFIYNVAGISGNGAIVDSAGSDLDLATTNFAGGVASNGTIARTATT